MREVITEIIALVNRNSVAQNLLPLTDNPKQFLGAWVHFTMKTDGLLSLTDTKLPNTQL